MKKTKDHLMSLNEYFLIMPNQIFNNANKKQIFQLNVPNILNYLNDVNNQIYL